MYAATIGEELHRTADRHGDVAAFHFHGRDFSYADWDAFATRFARALLAHGLRKGDRIGLLLPPRPEYMFCYLGAARIGVITAGISTRYRRHEIGAILGNADPRVLITVESAGDAIFAPLIAAAR
jgi:acyl-CoA synthetase (AMP-forming)/AMP-acid ligase II